MQFQISLEHAKPLCPRCTRPTMNHVSDIVHYGWFCEAGDCEWTAVAMRSLEDYQARMVALFGEGATAA